MRRKTLYIILVLTVITFGGSLCYENRDSSWWPWVGHDEWPMMGYDLQASFSSSNWGPNPVEKTVWSHTVEENIIGLPILDGDRLVLSTTGEKIQALDRWTGDVLWTYNTDGPISDYGMPTSVNDRILTVTAENLIGIDSTDGARVWSTDLPDEQGLAEGSVVPAQDAIYVVGTSSLIAFDTDGGDILWKHQMDLIDEARFSRLPSRSEQEIFLGINNQNEPDNYYDLPSEHRLIGLKADSGDTTMNIDLPLEQGSISQPVYQGDTVYLRVHSNIVAVDPQADTVAWTKEVDSSLSRSISVKGDRLYTVTYDGTVYALNLENREILWETDLNGALESAPTVSGNGLYLTSESEVVRLDRQSGSVTDRFPVENGLRLSPIPANNHLYTVSHPATIHTLSN